MSELLQAVTHTATPEGKIIRYEHGALIKPRNVDSKELNKWYRWLHKLKVKYHWDNQPKF